jgi:O-antigen ligase
MPAATENITLRPLNDKAKLKWIYIACGAFIALNTFLIAKEFYWLALLPAALIIILLAIVSLDKVLLIIVFFTPLAITLKDETGFGAALSLPTEPLLFGTMMLFLFRVLYEGGFDSKVSRHPITLCIYFYLAWMTITTLTSTMPIVSLKFLISKLWFLCGFYFLATQLFRDYRNVKRYMWLYIIALTIVIFYTIYNHSQGRFAEAPAHTAMVPFYNDHTSYGAVLAMFLPVLLAFLWNTNYSRSIKLFTGILLLIFVAATILSYTRAAWVGLALAFALYMIYWLRIKFIFLALAGLGILTYAYANWEQLLIKLEKNKQASATDLAQHVESISNIANDASNLERINRWESALRMFRERPVLGWGPGTYQFKYAPFQLSSERTGISTNSGNKGNAHSEYIGPLAEQGVFGLVAFLSILVAVYYRGSKLYYRLRDKEMKRMVLVILLGLSTYYLHGMLNNFLDTDKASAPFWGFIAMIVAIDVYHTDERGKDEAVTAGAQ